MVCEPAAVGGVDALLAAGDEFADYRHGSAGYESGQKNWRRVAMRRRMLRRAATAKIFEAGRALERR